MSPALAMVAPQMGIGFAVYEFVKANPPASLAGGSSVRTVPETVTTAAGVGGGEARAGEGMEVGVMGERGGERVREVVGVGGVGVGTGTGVLAIGEREEGPRRRRQRQRCEGDGAGLAHGAAEGGEREGSGAVAVAEEAAVISGGGGKGVAGSGGGIRRWGRTRRERWVEETAWPLVAGAAAGMTSKLAVFPLDTVKKRVQTEVTHEKWM